MICRTIAGKCWQQIPRTDLWAIVRLLRHAKEVHCEGHAALRYHGRDLRGWLPASKVCRVPLRFASSFADVDRLVNFLHPNNIQKRRKNNTIWSIHSSARLMVRALWTKTTISYTSCVPHHFTAIQVYDVLTISDSTHKWRRAWDSPCISGASWPSWLAFLPITMAQPKPEISLEHTRRTRASKMGGMIGFPAPSSLRSYLQTVRRSSKSIMSPTQMRRRPMVCVVACWLWCLMNRISWVYSSLMMASCCLMLLDDWFILLGDWFMFADVGWCCSCWWCSFKLIHIALRF